MTTKTKGRSTRTRGAKATKGKARVRGDGDKAVAREDKEKRYMEGRIYKRELQQVADNPLPFQIVHQLAVMPTWDKDKQPLRYFTRHQWEEDLCQIARAALRRGWRLLIPVPDDMVAFATSEIVRRLKLPVRVHYTRLHKALFVGMLNEDEIEDEQAGDETDEGAGDAARVA